MANTSEEFVNSTSISPLIFKDCLKETHFGIISFFAIMALCFIVGTPAHLWCLWFYLRSVQKIKETQVFLLNHVVMEIIYSLSCGVQAINIFTYDYEILWNIGIFLFGVAWIGRALLQTCICIEQYLAVLHPLMFMKYKGIKYRIGVVAAAWMLACGYGFYGIYAMIFPDFMYTVIFIITMVVISFCCVSVLCALKHPGPGNTQIIKNTKKDVGNKQKRNAFNTIFSAFLLIVFTYLPQALLIFTGHGDDQLLFTCNIVPLVLSINIFGVIITPLVKLYKEMSKGSKGN